MKIGKVLLILCLMAGVIVASVSLPSVPSDQTITFQGFLTESNNSPHQGEAVMGFRFFNHPTDAEDANEIFKLGTYWDSFSIGTYDQSRNIRKITVFNGNYTTKIHFSLDEISIMNISEDIWVEVYVTTNTTDIVTDELLLVADHKLNTRIQLNAVPYALSIKGLGYDSARDMVMLGYKNTDIVTGNNSNPRGGLVVSGRVGIGGPNINPNNNNLQLFVSSATYSTIPSVMATGNVMVPQGRVSANRVFGAVWN